MIEEENTIEEPDDGDFEELSKLKTSAPANTVDRLNKRVQTAQLGKDLVEKQAYAFWTVIDAFLKLIFGSTKKDEVSSETGEKNERNI